MNVITHRTVVLRTTKTVNSIKMYSLLLGYLIRYLNSLCNAQIHLPTETTFATRVVEHVLCTAAVYSAQLLQTNCVASLSGRPPHISRVSYLTQPYLPFIANAFQFSEEISIRNCPTTTASYTETGSSTSHLTAFTIRNS